MAVPLRRLHRAHELEVVVVGVGERRDRRVIGALEAVRLGDDDRPGGLEALEVGLDVLARDIPDDPTRIGVSSRDLVVWPDRDESSLAVDRSMTPLARVDHAEPVALGIRQDHIVGVRRPFGPVDLGGAQGQQALDLARLVVGVQVEVDSRRHLHGRAYAVQGDAAAA